DAYQFHVPMTLAFSAASYHFWMNVSPKMYIKSHSMKYWPSGRTVRQTDIRSMGPEAYLRVRYQQALPHAHLYTRGLNRSKPENITMVVKFGEVPPGTLGITTALAWLSAILMIAFGLAVPTAAATNSDVLA